MSIFSFVELEHLSQAAELKIKQDSNQLLHIKEDVKGTVPMCKTHLNFTKQAFILLEPVEKMSILKSQVKLIQAQFKIRHLNRTLMNWRGFFVDRVNINNERTTPMREPFWS